MTLIELVECRIVDFRIIDDDRGARLAGHHGLRERFAARNGIRRRVRCEHDVVRTRVDGDDLDAVFSGEDVAHAAFDRNGSVFRADRERRIATILNHARIEVRGTAARGYFQIGRAAEHGRGAGWEIECCERRTPRVRFATVRDRRRGRHVVARRAERGCVADGPLYALKVRTGIGFDRCRREHRAA